MIILRSNFDEYAALAAGKKQSFARRSEGRTGAENENVTAMETFVAWIVSQTKNDDFEDRPGTVRKEDGSRHCEASSSCHA